MLCESFAKFAVSSSWNAAEVKVFNRKVREGFRKGRKGNVTTLSSYSRPCTVSTVVVRAHLSLAPASECCRRNVLRRLRRKRDEHLDDPFCDPAGSVDWRLYCVSRSWWNDPPASRICSDLSDPSFHHGAPDRIELPQITAGSDGLDATNDAVRCQFVFVSPNRSRLSPDANGTCPDFPRDMACHHMACFPFPVTMGPCIFPGRD